MSSHEWSPGGEEAGRSQGGDAGGPGLGPRALIEPGHHPFHIDSGRGGDVLPVGVRHTLIARASEPKGAHALREGSFDTSPPLIALLALRTPLPGPRGFERLVLGLGRQPYATALLLRPGA